MTAHSHKSNVPESAFTRCAIIVLIIAILAGCSSIQGFPNEPVGSNAKDVLDGVDWRGINDLIKL
jgi:hypothetical protein